MFAVHDPLWDWERYWIPHSTDSRALVSRLLPANPASDYLTLAELSDRRLLVLLGEPGSGKSVEIRREKERIESQLGSSGLVIFLDGRTTIHSEQTLRRMWFESDSWKTWQPSSEDIWIFFDGFDEGVQHVSNLTEIIRYELSQTLQKGGDQVNRLFLRFASRTTGWQQNLSDVLIGLLYPNEISKSEDLAQHQYTFHLAPPRWDDIQSAAESRGLDGKQFRERVREENIESLALRPAQLEWLLNIFEAGGQLPQDKVKLYWEGILQLCQDPVQGFDAEHLRAIAGRAAFLTTFGGDQSIWLGLDRGDVPPDSIQLNRLAGGTEPTIRDEVPVTNEVLLELVTSGLFTKQEPNQAVWAHQTYPEYLAAKYCNEKCLPLSQITGLISNPLDRSGKVVPGMIEVAAWMAAMNPELLDYLLEHHPRALIESDVALSDPTDRERLLHGFLNAVEDGQGIRTRWPQRGQYASLYFHRMGESLAPFITDKSLRKETRDTAIDIAVDCRLDELAEVLATVALDQTEREVLRRSAAWAVTRLENDQARQQLKPLIAATADEDPLEDLKGCAMRANWPLNLSVQELLEHLTAPRWHGLGAYRSFLSGFFVQNLSDDALFPALKWLDEQMDWGENSFDLHELETLLIRKTFKCFDDNQISTWIAQRAVSNLTHYNPIFGERTSDEVITDLLSSTPRRQMLLNEISRSIDDEEKARIVAPLIADYLRSREDWLAEDFTWMADRLDHTADGSTSEVFWLNALKEAFSWNSSEQHSILFDLYSNPRFSDRLGYLFEPINRVSDEAERLKKHWNLFRQSSPQIQDPKIDIEEHIVAILNRVEDGSSTEWWGIDDWLKVDQRDMKYEQSWITDVSEQPGWHRCSTVTQRRIIETASQFLHSYNPDNSHIDTPTYSLADQAAYRALGLLLQDRPEEFDLLPDEIWRKLGPLVMGMHPQGGGAAISNQTTFLQKAMAAGFDPLPWLAKMASASQEGSAYYFTSPLNAVVSLASEDRLGQLVEELIKPETPIDPLYQTITELRERGVQGAFAGALRVVQEFAQQPDRAQDAARIVALLMKSIDQDKWHELWALIEHNDELFKESLLSFSHWDHDASEFARVLDEPSVAMLYLNLAESFPPSEDPNVVGMHTVSQRESLGRWREDLLSSLALRGTWEAVKQLRALAGQLSDIEWLPIRVAQAEEEARRRTWQPLSLDHLLELVHSTDARLINSPQQLHDVIMESLTRYQAELSAETPAAANLWNAGGQPSTFTPKDELHISDNIKHFLNRDLKGSGIIVNREVENRRGNENDIYIQYVDSNTRECIRVVCEVKGCWHRELYTSMSVQLHERYMRQQGISHGIYVVAYFDGERWDSRNYRSRHKVGAHSFEELQTSMVDQASTLTDEVFHVTSFVLDCRY